ncbi:MAG: ribokinase [Rhizobium sp.]|nr:ribokinase [Rhizobium sp.]
MAKTILVAGSLHYDVVVDAPRMPHLDETLPGKSVRYVIGGKGRNQAVAAARNGATTFMAGRIGDDTIGKTIKTDLIAQGVDASLMQFGEGQASGMSVAIVTPAGDYGAVVVSGSNLDFDPAMVELPDDTGFLLLQNEVTDEANIGMARKAHEAGVTVIFNAAPARQMAPELVGLVDILIVNRGEGEVLSGQRIEDVKDGMNAIGFLCGQIPKAIITLGGEGVVHMRAGGRAEHQAPFRADVVSAHGAGDFFIGALANRLASGSEFEAAIHYAQAAAAIYVSTEIDKRSGIRPVHIRARLGED